MSFDGVVVLVEIGGQEGGGGRFGICLVWALSTLLGKWEVRVRGEGFTGAGGFEPGMPIAFFLVDGGL